MAADGRLSRRGFIGGCVALAGLGLSGCSGRAELLEEGRRLTAAVTEREHWRLIGRAYVADGAPKLKELVAQLGAVVGSEEPGAMTQPLAEVVRLDFEQGRTIRVDGWVLAETEARVAALVALVDA
jgi:hypothetical protein